MPFTMLDEAESDGSQLHHFIRHFLAVMDEIVHKEHTELKAVPTAVLNDDLLPTELEQVFREAWLACREREAPLVLERIQTAPLERLQRHGLVGVELKAKLKSVVEFSEKLWQFNKKRALVRLLEMIDVVLKSILSAVGGGEALAELKEAIEKLISRDDP